jgi:hypothetical protein
MYLEITFKEPIDSRCSTEIPINELGRTMKNFSYDNQIKVKDKVILRSTVSRQVRLRVKHPSGARDHFSPFSLSLFLDSCWLIDSGRPR